MQIISGKLLPELIIENGFMVKIVKFDIYAPGSRLSFVL